MSAHTRVIDGKPRTLTRDYDPLSRVTQETYPDGEIVEHLYDGVGNLEELRGTLGIDITAYVSQMRYTAQNKLSSMDYGNGIHTYYDYYDSAGEYDPSAGVSYSYRLKEIQSNLLWLAYEYDRNGNVREKYDLGYSEYESYDYDALDRLVGADSTVYGQKSYQYNQIENIMQKDGRLYSYPPSGPSSVRPHAVSNDGLYSYSHDENGNMISRSDGRTYGYDADNHLVSVSGVGSYAYDPAGQRVLRAEGSVTTCSFFPGYEEDYEQGCCTSRCASPAATPGSRGRWCAPWATLPTEAMPVREARASRTARVLDCPVLMIGPLALPV